MSSFVDYGKLKRKVCYSGPEADGTNCKKLGCSIIEDEVQFEKFTAALVCCFSGEKTQKIQRIKKQPMLGLWENADENSPLIGCIIISLSS